MTDSELGDELAASLRTARDRLLAVRPYFTWLGAQDSLGIKGILQAAMLDMRGLDDLNSAWQQWGLMVQPFVEPDLSYALGVVPIYPLTLAPYRADETVQLLAGIPPAFTAHPPVTDPLELNVRRIDVSSIERTVPSLVNGPGDYTTRRIQAGVLDRFNQTADAVIAVQGTDPPTVLLEEDSALAFAQVMCDLARWGLQNAAERLSFNIANTYLRERHRFMYQDVEWRVQQVQHSWTAAQNVWSTVEAYRWQGGPQSLAVSTLQYPSGDVT